MSADERRVALQEANRLLGHWMGGINPCTCFRCQVAADHLEALAARLAEAERALGDMMAERDGAMAHFEYLRVNLAHAEQRLAELEQENQADADARAVYWRERLAEAERGLEAARATNSRPREESHGTD